MLFVMHFMFQINTSFRQLMHNMQNIKVSKGLFKDYYVSNFDLFHFLFVPVRGKFIIQEQCPN